MFLSDEQLARYSRNILVKEIGAEGQQKLLNAKVLVIGAGGLGSPVLFYLAAAGVGTLGIVDNDIVDVSNLQRQILHTNAAIGTPKTESAHAALQALNPETILETYLLRLTEANAESIIARYDIVADGCDNFDTRFLVNRICHQQGKTLVSAAIKGFEGIISVYKPYAGEGNPCYQCFQPEIPPQGALPSCTQSGVLGAVAGVMGSLMAIEITKEIMGAGKSLSGTLLRYNALSNQMKQSILKPDPDCPICAKAEAKCLTA